MKFLRILSAAFFGAALFVAPAVLAETHNDPLWGGNTPATAGVEKPEQLLDGEFSLKEHVRGGQKVFLKLPALKPGQGVAVTVTNSLTTPDIENNTIIENKPSVGKISVEDSAGKQYCEALWDGDDRLISCRTGAVSSEKQSYQWYAVIEGKAYNNKQGTSKDIKLAFDVFERYDEASKEDDAPNKLKNALTLEPGEYSGYLTDQDMVDFYKIDGLVDGATVNFSASFSVDDEAVKKSDGEFLGHYGLKVYVYNERKKKINRFSNKAKTSLDLDIEEEGTLSVPVQVVAQSGGLKKKVSRYFEVKFECLRNPCLPGTSLQYHLNAEVEGMQYEFTGGGDSANCAGFHDVVATDRRCAAVAMMKEKGIMTGTGDGTQFEGSKELNRAALAATIVKFMGEMPPGNDDLGGLAQFHDISSSDGGQWYVGPLRKAMALGLVNGFPDKTMRPADPVNKAQFVLIFAKAKKVKLPAVTEAPAKDVSATADSTVWYRAAVKYTVDNGLVDLIQGYFYPNAAVTRFEVADLLYRWFTKMQGN